FFPAARTPACTAASSGGLVRSTPPHCGRSLRFCRWWIRLEDRGLAFHVRLRLLDLFFDFCGCLRLGSRRLSRRIELRSEIHHHHALFLLRLHPNYGFVLRVIQKLAELLESV